MCIPCVRCAFELSVQSVYAPVVFLSQPMFGRHSGVWEPYGTGMLAFYVTELAKLAKPNRLPMADKTDWGAEDWALLWV
jgi:hypothetical protein